MKIECDKCGAKYSIADDKVRGKTFKIRCKKCSNVIIVRDKAGGGDTAESEAPADEPGWHLAIGGETVGPLTEAEVRERFASGEIDRETSVWQEGFEDWLPLADVPTFSDLADRAGAASPTPAAAPDPFSAGGEEDYSRGGFGAGGGASEDFGHSPEPVRVAAVPVTSRAASTAAAPAGAGVAAVAAGEPASPRVNTLSSARNENSVLFSLDSLSTMAMGSGKPSASTSTPSAFSVGGGGGSHSPSAAGNSEGSGLIDIRSMGAMLGGGGGGGGGGADDDRDDSMLPSFGGTGFGGLAAAPLLTAPPAGGGPSEAVISEPQRNNQTPLYLLIGVLVIGLGGLAAYVLLRPPPEPQERIVERIVAPAVQPDKKDDDDKKKDKDEDGEADADADGPPTGDKKSATKPGDKKPTKPGDKKTPKPGDKKGETGTSTVTGDTKTETKEVKKPVESDATPSVECILDPSKCKKSGGSSTSTKAPPDASMPEKLKLADIKAGTAGPKASAESNCRSKAKGGEKVKIKLSIAGPSGTVISSAPDDDAGNPALASCVASELKKANFKKVQKEQIGTIVSVTF